MNFAVNFYNILDNQGQLYLKVIKETFRGLDMIDYNELNENQATNLHFPIIINEGH